jgi:hypothetical protein
MKNINREVEESKKGRKKKEKPMVFPIFIPNPANYPDITR